MSNFPESIICETSTASEGNMDFRFGTEHEVIENRTHFLKKFGISYQENIAMRCDHGDIISLVDDKNPTAGATSQEAQIHSEVLITRKKRLALMLFTADCQPVSFYDPVTETIALAHISRKTLTQRLSQKTIHFLCSELNVAASDLIVHIGPHIKKASYAFLLPLAESSDMLKPYMEERDGFAYIDLVEANLAQLADSGIVKENISISNIDVGTTKNYYSYFMMKKRGEQQEARMATILMMR